MLSSETEASCNVRFTIDRCAHKKVKSPGKF